MSLSERTRSTLYRTLSVLVDDEEAVAEMLSYFPARDVEEPATKEFVRTVEANLRAEIHAATNKVIIWSVGLNVTMLTLVLTLTRQG